MFGAETLLYSCPYIYQSPPLLLMMRLLLFIGLFAGAVQASAQVGPRDTTAPTTLSPWSTAPAGATIRALLSLPVGAASGNSSVPALELLAY